jgi:uncharacterized protein (DUF362 family)
MPAPAAETLAEAPSVRPQAVVAACGGQDIGSTVVSALEEALLGHVLDVAAGTRDPAQVRIVIKPLLPPGTAVAETRRYVDPQLAASLSEWLRGQGWTDVTIAVPGPRGEETARAVGYSGDLVDLTTDLSSFHFGGLIGEHRIARPWREADVRILVGKALADPQLFYSGALTGALGCLPYSEQLAHRIVASQGIAESASDILERLPVAFGLLDASPSTASPGSTGGAAAGTRVLASSDLLALDWVLGELMDLDGPDLNPVVKEALQRRGPLDLDRRGDLTELDPWRNPSPTRVALSEIGAGRWWGRITGSREVPWTDR